MCDGGPAESSARPGRFETASCVCTHTTKFSTLYRKPRRGLAHISDFCMENSPELYIDKTRTAKVVLKSIWCSFYLKVQQRRAHDESQVRRRPIF
jgi:hypothetical protein